MTNEAVALFHMGVVGLKKVVERCESLYDMRKGFLHITTLTGVPLDPTGENPSYTSYYTFYLGYTICVAEAKKEASHKKVHS